MKFRHGILGQSMAQVCVCLTMLCLFLFSVQRNALCQVPSPSEESEAKQLVVRLRSALEKHDIVQADQIGRELQALGTTALPAIRESMPEYNKVEARQFTSILASISGNEATQLLMQFACQSSDTNIASDAIHAIGNRPINFALNTNQFEKLVNEIRNGQVLNAAAAACLLSRCEKNNKSQIVRPILERFIKEIANPTNIGRLHGSYVSPRVYTLNLFLLSFVNLQNEAVGELKTALDKAKTQDIRKWLILALGMCGEPSVVAEIRHLIENDADINFRSVAVRAYARSAGKDAVPVLQKLLTDKTESEYDHLPDGTPVYLIKLVAQDELVRLGHPVNNVTSQPAPFNK